MKNIEDQKETLWSTEEEERQLVQEWEGPKTIQADKVKEKTLVKELIESEGYRRDPYKDTKGLMTGGIGHLMTERDFKMFDPNWSKEEKDEYWTERFKEDLERTLSLTDELIEEKGLKVDETQFEVLAEMMFNLGPNRIRKFENMLEALSGGKAEEAADEMIDSKWHRDFVEWNDGKDTSKLRSRKLEAKMRSTT